MSDKVNKKTFVVPLRAEWYNIEVIEGECPADRKVSVDGIEIPKRERKTDSAGNEMFTIVTVKSGDLKCSLFLNPETGVIELKVNDILLSAYKKNYYKQYSCWVTSISGVSNRIVLDKSVMDVWVNKLFVKSDSFFIDNGNYVEFLINSVPIKIISVLLARGPDDPTKVLTQTLYINGTLADPPGPIVD
uniref:Fas apoptotic inhibitory molecule 1 n=1 Tax=Caenorhabditis tropicalis TaxID=1561998 RepID=A0A1I7TLN3_9PELO